MVINNSWIEDGIAQEQAHLRAYLIRRNFWTKIFGPKTSFIIRTKCRLIYTAKKRETNPLSLRTTPTVCQIELPSLIFFLAKTLKIFL
jgi:hypothetical protein